MCHQHLRKIDLNPGIGPLNQNESGFSCGIYVCAAKMQQYSNTLLQIVECSNHKYVPSSLCSGPNYENRPNKITFSVIPVAAICNVHKRRSNHNLVCIQHLRFAFVLVEFAASHRFQCLSPCQLTWKTKSYSENFSRLHHKFVL